MREEVSRCGGDVDCKWDRDAAPQNRPIYHRLHSVEGGFPDVVLTEPRSLGPLADDPYVNARRFLDSDPGEDSPLGRAELIKLTALLVGSVETGNSLFDLIEVRYNHAKSLAMQAKSRPTVMVGKPGTWNEAARSSWMITVGTTYVGQLLRDANVEYRNSDDSVNEAICGSGCGVCPSGTSDTRCSVPIADYVDLFRSTDYWIAAGIGANCWSGSCNFELTSDDLLKQNQIFFPAFRPMQCGGVIALDKSHEATTGANSYWQMGRIRPDLIFRDLVVLMHPDVAMEGEDTTFFRLLPPLTNATGVPACPRPSSLPAVPETGTVHVSAAYGLELPDFVFDVIGASHLAVLDKLYPDIHGLLATELGVEDEDLEIDMANTKEGALVVTVRVSPCDGEGHACAVDVGEKMRDLGPALQEAIGLSGVTVKEDLVGSLHVVDAEGDIIPLFDLENTSVC